MPDRIQLSRRAGWRKPPGAVVVARPSRWGNPFPFAEVLAAGEAETKAAARSLVVARFREWMLAGPRSPHWRPADADRWTWMNEHLNELAGHDLACWCPLWTEDGRRGPCHADVLLELANAGWRPPAR